MVLEKRSLAGASQWVDTFNLSAVTASMLLGDMVLDSNADIIITGSVLNGSNSYDAITIKYENSGQLDWYQLFDGAASSYDGGLRVNVGTADQIYVTGGSLGSSSDMDLMVLSYSASGSLLWSKTFPQYTNFDVGSFIDENAGGLVRVASLHEQTSGGWQLRYIRLERIDGQINSNNISAAIDMEEVRDVWINDNDELFATGYTNGSGSGRDVMTVKFTSAAAIAWTQTYDSGQLLDDEAMSLATTSGGGVVVGGFAQNSSEGKNGLLLSYSSGGNLLWSKTINGAADEDDEVTDVLLDESNDLLYLCGQIKNGSTADYLFAQHQLSTGNSLEQFAHAGKVGGNDRAESLLMDAGGGILISGKTDAGNNNLGATTVRYVTKDYFLPPNTDAFNDNLPFVKNQDQLLSTNGKIATDVKYYTNGSPSCFFQDNSMSMVLSNTDPTIDSMFRVDVLFGDNKSHSTFALNKRSSYNNYYLDHIPSGRPHVSHYDQVLHTDAWEGIDVLHGSNQAGMTYTFIVEPGVNVASLELTFKGQNNLSTNANGELVINTDFGDIIWPLPIAAQYDLQSNEYPSSLTPSYIITGDKVKINAINASNDRYLVLCIKKSVDSTVGFAGTNWITYFGTDNDYGNDPEYESFNSLGLGGENNYLFLGGLTVNTFLPEDIGLVTLYGSSVPDMNDHNAFLVKFDDADVFQFGTIWGGSEDDECKDIAVYDDDVFVVGNSNSPSFPVTNGNSSTNFMDGFIGSFNANDGTRTRLELFSGNADDDLTTIDVSSTGRLFVAGSTFSTDIMPFTKDGAYNQSADNIRNELIVMEMDQEFKTIWSTFLGHYITSQEPIQHINDIIIKPNEAGFYITGTVDEVGYNQSDNVPPTSSGMFSFPKYSQSGNDTQLAVNNGGGIGLTDAFIAEFGSNNQLLWTTFVGGNSGDILHPKAHSTLAINPNDHNEITLVGKSYDFSSFPSSTIGYQETTLNNTLRKDFIATFKNRQLSWTSSFGGASTLARLSVVNTVNYDHNENIIITGGTDFHPITLTDNCSPAEIGGVFPYCPTSSLSEFTQSTLADANDSPLYMDTYIAIFSPNKDLRYSSYLGGNKVDQVNDASFRDYLYLGGVTSSNLSLPVDFPSGAYMQDARMGQADGLIARLAFNTSIAVSTREILSERSLKIFPNPTQGRVIIELPLEYSATNIKDISIQFFNTIGQEVNLPIIYDSNAGKIEIDLGAFPTGAYTCKLGNFQGRIIKI